MLAPCRVTSLATMVSSVAAGYDNGDIIIWDSSRGSNIPFHQFNAHQVAVVGLSFYGKLDTLASMGTGETFQEAATQSQVHFWSSSTFQLRETVSMHGAITRCVKMLEVPPELCGPEPLPSFVVATGQRRKEQLKLFSFVDENHEGLAW